VLTDPSPPRSPLTLLFRVLALLGAGGASLGLALASVVAWRELAAFAATNRIDPSLRRQMLTCIVGGMLLAPAAGLLAARLSKTHNPLGRLYNAARRLAPLYWVGCLPLLLHRQIWVKRETDFLFLVALFSLGEWMAIKTAQRSERLGWERQLVAWFGPVNSGLWSVLPSQVRRHWAGAALLMLGAAAAYAALTTTSHGVSDPAATRELTYWLAGGQPMRLAALDGRPSDPHAGFFGYVLAAAYWLVPSAQTPQVTRTALVVGAALPLFLMARRQLGAGPALLVSVSYLLSPAMVGMEQCRSCDLPLALGFFWWTWDGLKTRRDVRAGIAMLLGLAVGEQVALWFVVAGAYLVLSRERPTAGLIVAVLSSVYFVSIAGFWLPRYGGVSVLAAGDKGLRHAVSLFLANPVHSLSKVVETCRLVDWLKLLVPLALLPLRSPMAWLWLIPGLWFTFSTRDACPGSPATAYGALWVALSFVGVTLALQDLRRRAVDRVRPHVAALAALVCASACVGQEFGSMLYSPPSEQRTQMAASQSEPAVLMPQHSWVPRVLAASGPR
jgi:hypothetical protein